jgi:exosome complex exonuclease RRP6
MNVDHDQPPHTTATAAAKAQQALQTLTAGPLTSSVAKLAASSRCIPSERDYFFYRNFNEFKVPVDEISRESQSMLEAIGVAANAAFPDDIDDGYDWLVNVNDDVLERFDVSADEFRKVREEEEKSGRVNVNEGMMVEDGFELVCGKKKKGGRGKILVEDSEIPVVDGVKVAMKDKKTLGPKAKIPFHIPTIRRPQEEYSIIVNNSNLPFEHVWLQRSDDGLKFVHPLVSSFIGVFDICWRDIYENFDFYKSLIKLDN